MYQLMLHPSKHLYMWCYVQTFQRFYLELFSLLQLFQVLCHRKSLNLFANLRPAYFYEELLEACPIKKEIIGNGFDMMIVRELTGGLNIKLIRLFYKLHCTIVYNHMFQCYFRINLCNFLMMLRYSFDLEEEAGKIESAVKQVLAEGYRTVDIICVFHLIFFLSSTQIL